MCRSLHFAFGVLITFGIRHICRLKTLNNWPTFPQLIINGEFVGGLDVVQEMVDNGELADLIVQYTVFALYLSVPIQAQPPRNLRLFVITS